MVRRCDGAMVQSLRTIVLPHHRTSLHSSEARRQVELPEPATPGPVKRSDVVQFQNRVAKRIQTQRGADAAHPVAAAAKRTWLVALGPCRSGIAKECDFNRQRSVE